MTSVGYQNRIVGVLVENGEVTFQKRNGYGVHSWGSGRYRRGERRSYRPTAASMSRVRKLRAEMERDGRWRRYENLSGEAWRLPSK